MDRRDELMREHVACRRRSDETRVDRSLPLFMITCKTCLSIDSRIIAHEHYGCATPAVTRNTALTNNNNDLTEGFHKE